MKTLDPTAKALMITGLVLLSAGALWHFGVHNLLKIGRLPGDLVIERPHMKIYVPLTTCLLLSLLASLLAYILRR